MASSTALAVAPPTRSTTWPITTVSRSSAPPSSKGESLVSYLQNVISNSGFVWVSDGRPDKVLPFKHAKPADQPLAMRPLQRPKRVQWPVLLSAAQIWELLEGHVPNTSDEADKWFVYSTFEYHPVPEAKSKKAAAEGPKNVNGLVRTHFCLAKTARTLFVLEAEVVYIDVVVRAHPECFRHRFEYAEMITGVVSGLDYETDEDIVGGVTEEKVKEEIKGICARILEIFLLVKGIVPVRMEDRSSAERLKESLKMKLDFESAMQRVASSKLKLLTGSGRADAMAKMLQGRSGTQLFLEKGGL